MVKSQEKSILFVCIGNSCRSQMAEGFTHDLHRGKLKAYSAGIRPSKIDSLAIQVMAEVGVDISTNEAKTIDSLSAIEFDYVVTVCEAGAEECPLIPARIGGLRKVFADPPKLVAGMESMEDTLMVYRAVRDEIRTFVESLPSRLGTGTF